MKSPARDSGPWPISVAVEPKSRPDLQRLGMALKNLKDETSPRRIYIDDASEQFVIHGDSECDLDHVISRLIDEFHLEVNVGMPQIAYRETISREIEQAYTHTIVTNGGRQTAEVAMLIKPMPSGDDVVFENRSAEDAIPEDYIPRIEMVVQSVLNSGPLAGFPMTNIKIVLVDARYRDREPAVEAFEIATRICMRDGLQKAGLKIVEPVMRIAIDAPEAFSGAIKDDLSRRRGKVLDQTDKAGEHAVEAKVPVSNLFGYDVTLRSITAGKARFSSIFSHYQEVPGRVDPGFPDDFPPAKGMRG